ncbi:hypothetical protein [Vulcanisaeta thermophila]|uniref:hypothetical protein n=1 Tax=Vulcanisaeta thermophila TaxID=867917 RepID=UPI000852FB98|nr:hypothetical protein [Vulcanisaeta thermophila]
MSTLVKDLNGVSIQCDMDYGKYVINGVNYVPCTLTTKNAELVLKVLSNYLTKNPHYSSVTLRLLTSNSLEIRIPRTLLDAGESFGEFVDLLLHMIIGIRECAALIGVK